ncbi:MAG: aminofutalosine synthase MqnE, partial [Bacteroidia bacterium]
MQTLSILLDNQNLSKPLVDIAQKVMDSQRISFEEGVYLYEHAELGYLGVLANYIREKKHGDRTYFNRNFHLEPTNLCVYDCKFCSYSRLLKQKEEGWALTMDEMLSIVQKYDDEPVTEVHVVG